MMLLNGVPADSIGLTDRSFQYGDGCFTTMLTRDGEIEHWPLHIERMNACLKVLKIPEPDWPLVHQWLLSAAQPVSKAGLKLHISRGEGGRGYSPTHVTSPNVTISDFTYPVHYEQWRRQGVVIGLCSTRLGHNPLLAGHKHNNRLEQVILKAEMDQLGLADGIALDLDGRVIETTMANLFWLNNRTLCTPDLSRCGVAGVMRRLVFDIAQQLGIPVCVDDYQLPEMMNADEVFMVNSLLGVAPICQVGKKSFEIGTITTRIQEMIAS
ncbi:aminodeoxychorismate lyase [Vibrio sp. JPW-9-11-11]|uniref:aminodeoxychorismate lyase n=1 Tax=Vibrio sp. JPW-9-11-11 TaxID=1416532 RepID=UPI001594994D|nr:aminodeoxychorismate lyase [Vibrio sp. JPW-9-11-11]NVD07030.1 aminodeoxychorismate lyase [Vibrio sp. JPW-9-11-11]